MLRKFHCLTQEDLRGLLRVDLTQLPKRSCPCFYTKLNIDSRSHVQIPQAYIEVRAQVMVEQDRSPSF